MLSKKLFQDVSVERGILQLDLRPKTLWAICIVISLLTGGCVSGPGPSNTGVPGVLDFSNAGLAVGRTLNISTWGEHAKPNGFVMYFMNAATKEVVETNQGLVGFTKNQYFAVWLPPGRYFLDGVFAYNGALGPADVPLTFNIKKGEASYIGTIMKSWDAPSHPGDYGEIVATSKYGRWNCSFFSLDCDEKTKSRAVKAPYATVFVVDEGAAFIDGLNEELPNLGNLSIVRELMKAYGEQL